MTGTPVIFSLKIYITCVYYEIKKKEKNIANFPIFKWVILKNLLRRGIFTTVFSVCSATNSETSPINW